MKRLLEKIIPTVLFFYLIFTSAKLVSDTIDLSALASILKWFTPFTFKFTSIGS